MTLTLLAARKNQNYTQEEAAAHLGISVCTLANYERGKTYPDVPVIKKMERLYGVEFKNLFFG